MKQLDVVDREGTEIMGLGRAGSKYLGIVKGVGVGLGFVAAGLTIYSMGN